MVYWKKMSWWRSIDRVWARGLPTVGQEEPWTDPVIVSWPHFETATTPTYCVTGRISPPPLRPVSKGYYEVTAMWKHYLFH